MENNNFGYIFSLTQTTNKISCWSYTRAPQDLTIMEHFSFQKAAVTAQILQNIGPWRRDSTEMLLIGNFICTSEVCQPRPHQTVMKL